jgi:hypothetical protein
MYREVREMLREKTSGVSPIMVPVEKLATHLWLEELLKSQTCIGDSRWGSWDAAVLAAHQPGDQISLRITDQEGNDTHILTGRSVPLGVMYKAYAQNKSLKPSQFIILYKNTMILESWTANGTGKGQNFRLEDQCQLHVVRLVNITIKDNETHDIEVFFKIRSTEKMQAVFQEYANRKGRDISTVVFKLNDKNISSNATPVSLTLAEHNIIEAFTQDLALMTQKRNIQEFKSHIGKATVPETRVVSKPILQNGGNVITLRVYDEDTKIELSFNTTRQTPLACLFRVVAQQKGLKAAQMQFSYNDHILLESYSAASIGLKSEDLIIACTLVTICISMKDMQDNSEVSEM